MPSESSQVVSVVTPTRSPSSPSPSSSPSPPPSPSPPKPRSSQQLLGELNRKSTNTEGAKTDSYNATAVPEPTNPLRNSTIAAPSWGPPEPDGCFSGLDVHREKLNRVKEAIYPVCSVLMALAIGSDDDDLITDIGAITGMATVLIVVYYEFTLVCKDQEELIEQEDFDSKLQDAGMSRATVACLLKDVSRATNPQLMQEKILSAIETNRPTKRSPLQQLSYTATSILLPTIFGVLIPLSPWLVSQSQDLVWEVFFTAGISLAAILLITITSPPPGTWTEIIASQVVVFFACIGVACAIGAICIPLRQSSPAAPAPVME